MRLAWACRTDAGAGPIILSQEYKVIDQERLINTFCDLVRIDSPSGEEEAVAQELRKRLTTLGFEVKRDAHGNLIAVEEGENPLLLSGHMDTVEPGRGIKPRVDGDRIVSDGATILGGDCKAGIAAILEALESIHEDGANRIPVQLAFTRGEELGLVGARNLDFSLLSAREAVVFDGNGPSSKITTASPTYMSFEVRITGKAAHAGVEPEKGLSAIRIASEIITDLHQGRIDHETTFNTATISGGSVRNAVPETASFTGEFRSLNVETLDLVRLHLLNTLEEARRKYPDAVIKEDLNVEYEMYALPSDDAMIERVSRVLVPMGLHPQLEASGGGTDANILSQNGISCVVVGMSTQEMHTTREYVPIKDLMDTAMFCQALLINQ